MERSERGGGIREFIWEELCSEEAALEAELAAGPRAFGAGIVRDEVWAVEEEAGSAGGGGGGGEGSFARREHTPGAGPIVRGGAGGWGRSTISPSSPATQKLHSANTTPLASDPVGTPATPYSYTAESHAHAREHGFFDSFAQRHLHRVRSPGAGGGACHDAGYAGSPVTPAAEAPAPGHPSADADVYVHASPRCLAPPPTPPTPATPPTPTAASPAVEEGWLAEEDSSPRAPRPPRGHGGRGREDSARDSLVAAVEARVLEALAELEDRLLRSVPPPPPLSSERGRGGAEGATEGEEMPGDVERPAAHHNSMGSDESEGAEWQHRARTHPSHSPRGASGPPPGSPRSPRQHPLRLPRSPHKQPLRLVKKSIDEYLERRQQRRGVADGQPATSPQSGGDFGGGGDGGGGSGGRGLEDGGGDGGRGEEDRDRERVAHKQELLAEYRVFTRRRRSRVVGAALDEWSWYVRWGNASAAAHWRRRRLAAVLAALRAQLVEAAVTRSLAGRLMRSLRRRVGVEALARWRRAVERARAAAAAAGPGAGAGVRPLRAAQRSIETMTDAESVLAVAGGAGAAGVDRDVQRAVGAAGYAEDVLRGEQDGDAAATAAAAAPASTSTPAAAAAAAGGPGGASGFSPESAAIDTTASSIPARRSPRVRGGGGAGGGGAGGGGAGGGGGLELVPEEPAESPPAATPTPSRMCRVMRDAGRGGALVLRDESGHYVPLADYVDGVNRAALTGK